MGKHKESDGLSEKTSDGRQHEQTQTVSFYQLFRFAQWLDYVLLLPGLFAAVISGLIMPVQLKLFGYVAEALMLFGARKNTIPINDTLNALNETMQTTGTTWKPYISDEEFSEKCLNYLYGTLSVGIIQWILFYIYVVTLNVAAERQVYRIRSLFFKSILRQDIGWYDTQKTGEFASQMSDNLNKMQDGIGEKLGIAIYYTSTFVFCIIISFAYGWKLTLVTIALTPITIISTAIVGKMQTSFVENEMKAYATSGSIAQEVLIAIRTVIAFGGEEKEVNRYDNNLNSATEAGIRRGFVTAIGGAVMWFIYLATDGLALWYGVKLVVDNRGEVDPEYDSDSMLVIYASVMMGSRYMGQAAPYYESFSQAKAAASFIFHVIDRVPIIDSSSETGYRPNSVTGDLAFENVLFNYPSRPDVKILQGLNLRISKGETVALVGESGCGKSTTVHLLQRFYDPLRGTVRLDGYDIKLLNLGWLRNHIGMVGQEPILFATTIAENIKYGQDGATQGDIERAAKMANAHDFIIRLPKRYETQVGDRGAQLSGGQKQRIAIARALIKDPKILLLDEATSALDSESEAVVQSALDKARQGRTTIIIAHRLSTVRNADKIAAFSSGQVAEIGTHDELMELNGIYCRLVTTQMSDNDHSPEIGLPSPPLPPPPPEIMINKEFVNKRPLSIISNLSFGEFPRRLSLSYEGSLRISQRIRRTHPITEEEEKENPKPSLLKILKQNQPEWLFILFGCLGSLGMGFCIPAYSLLFGEVMGTLAIADPDEAMRRAVFFSIIYVVTGIVTGTCSFFQTFMFTMAGERLTRRLRKLTFAAMLRQEISWFDDQTNSVGVLCSKLSGDTANIQGATGSRLGTILQFIFTLGIGCIVAIILHWKLALVSMAPLPLVLLATVLQSKINMGQSVNEMASLDNANKIAMEAISNIRTVAALHKEKSFYDSYFGHLKKQHGAIMKQAHLRSCIYGFASSVPWTCYGISLFYGSYLALHEDMDFTIAFKVSEILIFGTLTVGQALSFAPNYNQGIVSAGRILKLLERKSLIDSSDNKGLQLPENAEFNIDFKDVRFSYPTRRDMPILRGLNLTVPQGKLVALVGSSGCGKSTAIQLLERFYDPSSGHVTLEDMDIKSLNIKWLRSQIGIVSQEPILFDRTIAENIAYGDNTRDASLHEIIEAATSANAQQFISTLPNGYETRAGDKGTQLSGGQKQRIAIARALLRNPKILLLDEATSALDTESEKVVQEALEEAQKGRTCITVAHRLSTIRKADLIVVIHKGTVVETGSHDQLIALGGYYFNFHNTQIKKKHV